MIKQLLLFIVLLAGISVGNARNDLGAKHDSIPSKTDGRKVKITSEEKGDGMVYYAKNEYPCPVSLKFVYPETMHEKMGKETAVFVVPSLSNKTELITVPDFSCEDHNKTEIKYAFGNVFDETYEEDFPYTLPFELWAEFKAKQSSDGGFFHRWNHVIDFEMPLNTAVHAARAGIVARVDDGHIINCPGMRCPTMGNFVLIHHEDGTFAFYGHLFRDSIKVAIGDKVEVGQLIATSANSGWSDGLQLHFQVFLPGFENEGRNIQPKFKLDSISEPRPLEMDKVYRRSL